MVTRVDTSKNRMTELEKKVNMLMKVLEERDYEIESLKNHIKSRDATESSQTHTVKILTKERQLCKKVIHKIRLQLHRCLFSSCRK